MLTRDYELSVLSAGPGNVTQRQSEEKTSLDPHSTLTVPCLAYRFL